MGKHGHELSISSPVAVTDKKYIEEGVDSSFRDFLY
jgi:hypothetical protein